MPFFFMDWRFNNPRTRSSYAHLPVVVDVQYMAVGQAQSDSGYQWKTTLQSVFYSDAKTAKAMLTIKRVMSVVPQHTSTYWRSQVIRL